MRFWDPDSGEVRISGEDLRGVNTASLRDNEALVEQDTFLFHDTIRDNLLIASITRHGKTVIPDGESYFTEGDSVVVVTTGKNVLYRFSDIFA